MEKVKIKHFMPSIKMYRDMVQHEVTYFQFHNNTRFTVSSRRIPLKGRWVNPWRSVPYAYRWSQEEETFLPEHYKNRCREFMTQEPIPVHWRPDPRKYTIDDDSGLRVPVINAPIPVVYPLECNQGLWGGEGIIFGYFTKVDPRRQKKLPTRPRIWLPELTKRVFYSEILDRYMSIMVTERTRYLIDEAFGLDFYILQTHEVDLCSKLGITLKREMLLALARKSMHLDDSAKQEKLLQKYREYIIPEEEAEWIGLPVHEAVEKARQLHLEKHPPRPLKDLFILDLVKKLHLSGDIPDDEAGTLSKLRPFTAASKPTQGRAL